MQYGICSLSLVPVRHAPEETSEMVTQLLYGEHFKVLEHRKFYSKIRIAFDTCEGWVSKDQINLIQEEQFNTIQNSKPVLATDLVSSAVTDQKSSLPILLGSSVHSVKFLSHRYESDDSAESSEKPSLIQTALHYLNAPFLKGGKSPFGIDSAGLSQMVYKINGHALLRTAQQQSTQGDALSFIEESEAGDLAFFDNQEGEINHVGIIMDDNYIIHSHGKVRIDRLDHTGIFNTEHGRYTHSLRVIKKLI